MAFRQTNLNKHHFLSLHLRNKNQIIVLVIGSALFALIIAAISLSLFQKSYILRKSDLFKIDSVKILGKAYYLSGGKNSSKSGLEFEDRTFMRFQLNGAELGGQDDLKFLYDTLQYSQTIMTVYTDKEGLADYENKNADSRIQILGLTIGDRSYVRLDDLNKNSKQRSQFAMGFAIFIYVIFLVIYFKGKPGNNEI